MESRIPSWARHVARMGKRRDSYRVWWAIMRERNHLEDLGVDESTILKWIFRKLEGAWTDLAQNLGRWWEFVNPAINLRVP